MHNVCTAQYFETYFRYLIKNKMYCEKDKKKISLIGKKTFYSDPNSKQIQVPKLEIKLT